MAESRELADLNSNTRKEDEASRDGQISSTQVSASHAANRSRPRLGEVEFAGSSTPARKVGNGIK